MRAPGFEPWWARDTTIPPTVQPQVGSHQEPFFNLALRKSPSGKYFALRIVENKESGLSISLHTCLARRAKLNQWISLKLIPPLLFGTHNFHQAIQYILF